MLIIFCKLFSYNYYEKLNFQTDEMLWSKRILVLQPQLKGLKGCSWWPLSLYMYSLEVYCPRRKPMMLGLCGLQTSFTFAFFEKNIACLSVLSLSNHSSLLFSSCSTLLPISRYSLSTILPRSLFLYYTETEKPDREERKAQKVIIVIYCTPETLYICLFAVYL